MEKHWETICYNIILAKLILEKYMKVKNIKADAGKRSLSYSIVNAMGDNNPKVLKRPNKGRKYNSNTLKNRNNRTKRLALLGGCSNR